MEQHAIPQHIASFEFKLFGNLTVRQFVFLAIPLGLAALIFFSNLPTYFRFITSGLIAIVGAFIALVPYSGRSIDKWIIVFFKAVSSPTQRVWRKEIKIPDFLEILLEEPEVTKEPGEKEFTRQDREKLIEYLRSMPRGQVSPMDVRENLALERLDLSYDGAGEGQLPTPIFWGTTKGDKSAENNTQRVFKEEFRPESEIKLPKGVVSAKELRRTMGHSLPGFQSQTSTAAGVGVRISPHIKHYALTGLEKRLHAQAKGKFPAGVRSPTVQLASEANFSIENVIPITTVSRHVKLVHGIARARARKLHFAPPPGFDLSDLPIRGEAKFEISEELKRRFDHEEQVKMQALNDQIVSDEQPKKKEPSGFEHMFSSAISQAKSIVTGGGLKIQSNKVAVPKVKMTFQKPAVIAKNVTDAFPQASLKEEQREKIDSRLFVNSEKMVTRPTDAGMLTKAQFLPLTDKPNVISGVVTLLDESPLEGIIVIVRDANGLPIRALKTNKLGQFLSVTPLTSGNYSLEVEGEEQIFEPISIILTDKVIEPLMIKATE